MACTATNVRVLRLFLALLAVLHSAWGCREDQFRCANHGCIQAYNKCDGYVDCEDGSDESTEACGARCEHVQYSEGFACSSSGRCIRAWLKCNGHDECGDGSDETDELCGANWTDCEGAPFGVFACSNGQCVSSRRKCDGAKDCADGSDEDPSLCG